MKGLKLWIIIALVRLSCSFLHVSNSCTRYSLKLSSVSQEIGRRPVSLAKRALLKSKEKDLKGPVEVSSNIEPVVPQSVDDHQPIDVEASVDARLKAFMDPEVILIMKEQGVTPKELLAMSDAVKNGEYNPYNRDYDARKEKTKAIKEAKKVAKLSQQSDSMESKPNIIKRARDPKGLSSPIRQQSVSEVKAFNKPFISEPTVHLPPPDDYQRWPKADRNKHIESANMSPSDAALLHGVTLKDQLSFLIEAVGFPALYRETNVRCFYMEPSLISSLKCLRSVSMAWARQRIEAMYVEHKKKQMAENRGE